MIGTTAMDYLGDRYHVVDDPPANDNSPPLTCGVNGYGGETWCGLPWGSSFGVTNDRERVSCPGCRDKALEPASEATVEAEVRRACAAWPEIGELEFSFLPNPRPTMFCGQWSTRVMVNDHELYVSDFTFNGLRSGAHELAKSLLAAYDWACREAPCGVCRGAFSLLCHACKGGVGS